MTNTATHRTSTQRNSTWKRSGRTILPSLTFPKETLQRKSSRLLRRLTSKSRTLTYSFWLRNRWKRSGTKMNSLKTCVKTSTNMDKSPPVRISMAQRWQTVRKAGRSRTNLSTTTKLGQRPFARLSSSLDGCHTWMMRHLNISQIQWYSKTSSNCIEQVCPQTSLVTLQSTSKSPCKTIWSKTAAS